MEYGPTLVGGCTGRFFYSEGASNWRAATYISQDGGPGCRPLKKV